MNSTINPLVFQQLNEAKLSAKNVSYLDSNVFNFRVIDYDTKFGYDLLVTKDTALDLNQAQMYFVEMKFKLTNDFNHSFKKLSSIICWDTEIPNEYELEDMTGEKRIMQITPRGKNEK